MDYVVNKEKMNAIEKVVFRTPGKHKITFVLVSIFTYLSIAASIYIYVISRKAGVMTETNFTLCITALSSSFLVYGLTLISGRKYNKTFSDFRIEEMLSITNGYFKYRFYSMRENCFVMYEFDINDIISKEKHPEANMYRIHGDIYVQITDSGGHPIEETRQLVSDVSISDYFDGLDLSEMLKNIDNE